MQFKNLEIINFRNFENIDIELTNKNIIFGLNDIGKTNLLCAIRFLLDRDYRRYGFVDSDFYKKNIEDPIIITLTIDVTDFDDSDDIIIGTFLN